MTTQPRKSPGLPPPIKFEHLTQDQMRLVDAAVGDVLDNGFGTVELKYEYSELKWIVRTIPQKIQTNRVA